MVFKAHPHYLFLGLFPYLIFKLNFFGQRSGKSFLKPEKQFCKGQQEDEIYNGDFYLLYVKVGNSELLCIKGQKVNILGFA